MPDYALGARFRPPIAAEDKYHLRHVVGATVADLTQPRSLASYRGVDVRPPIEDQGSLGACAAYSAIACARVCAKVSGRDPAAPMLAGDALYAAARKREGTFPQDAGSYPADCLDLLITHGAPLETEAPERHDAAYDYGAAWDADAAPHEYVQAHHPFYPADGNILENIWLALDAGMPVQLAVAWPQGWFNPTRGIVPTGLSQIVGGHAIYIHTWEPREGGYVIAANQWGTSWSADTRAFPGTMRPGDFAIPGSIFTRPDTNVWECRAVSPRPYTPPAPQPLASDRLWSWVGAVANYCQSVAEPARQLEAPIVAAQLRAWYPAAKEAT